MGYVRWLSGMLLGNLLLAGSVSAVCPREMAIDNALAGLAPYADVKTPFTCKSPKTTAEKIICKSPLLLKLSELDARAQVFGLENAMGQEVSHKDYKDEPFEKDTLSRCKDEACICNAFSDRIQMAFPEFSP
jgi:uncharacterized protein